MKKLFMKRIAAVFVVVMLVSNFFSFSGLTFADDLTSDYTVNLLEVTHADGSAITAEKPLKNGSYISARVEGQLPRTDVKVGDTISFPLVASAPAKLSLAADTDWAPMIKDGVTIGEFRVTKDAVLEFKVTKDTNNVDQLNFNLGNLIKVSNIPVGDALLNGTIEAKGETQAVWYQQTKLKFIESNGMAVNKYAGARGSDYVDWTFHCNSDSLAKLHKGEAIPEYKNAFFEDEFDGASTVTLKKVKVLLYCPLKPLSDNKMSNQSHSITLSVDKYTKIDQNPGETYEELKARLNDFEYAIYEGGGKKKFVFRLGNLDSTAKYSLDDLQPNWISKAASTWINRGLYDETERSALEAKITEVYGNGNSVNGKAISFLHNLKEEFPANILFDNVRNNEVHFTGELNGEVFDKPRTSTVTIAGLFGSMTVLPDQVALKKVDTEGNPIQGAEFILEKKEGTNGQWEPVKDNANQTIVMTTDAEGKLAFDGLSASDTTWYRFVEQSVPLPYDMNSVTFKDILNQPIPNGEFQHDDEDQGKVVLATNDFVRISVTATKTWVNGPVTDHILTNSNLILSRRVGSGSFEVVNEDAQTSGNVHGPFTYVWNDLHKYNQAGELYEYKVEEAAVVNDQIALLNGNVYNVTKNGFDITNTYVSATDAKVTASKIWVDGPEADHTEVVIDLYREASQTPRELVVVDPANLTVTESVKGTFNYAWDNLEKTNQYGEEYVFTVEEAGVVNDEIALPNGNVYAVTQQANVITNTFVIATNAKVTAEKRWVNGPDIDHTAVTLELFREAIHTPKELVNKAYTSFESAPGVFKYKWEGLDKTNSAGEQYNYTVEEVGVTGGKVVVNGRTYTVTQEDNVITNTLPVFKLGDYVWYDTNKDGIQDAGETGVEGVKVILTTSSGAIATQTTVTDADGYYEFDGLPNGEYTVTFEDLPTGYQVSDADKGSDDSKDSDGKVDGGGNIKAMGTINDADNMTLDLGIHEKPTYDKLFKLGNYVWYDKNKDGIQDDDEIGVEDVVVKIKVIKLNTTAAAITTSDGAINMPVSDYIDVINAKTATTDANGLYLFTGLPDGEYEIEFVESTLPADYKITLTDVGGDAEDSDGLTPKGIINDADNMTIDLGIVPIVPEVKLYNLGDYVWYDDNQNGIQDAGEKGVPNVEVILYDSKGNKLADILTDSDGLYKFEGLPNGDYKVVFSNLPSGYVISPTDQGSDDAKDSDGLTATGEINGADNMTLDLGIYKPTTPAKTYKIGDTVWYDINKNGIQDAGETGVQGVTVTLTRADGTVITSTTTDASGNYLFENLQPGDYKVIFSNLPADYRATLSNQGSDDAKDSDGLNVSVTITNADDLTIDLGIYKKRTGGGSTGGGGGSSSTTTTTTTTKMTTTTTTTEPTTEPTTVPTTTQPTYISGNTPDPNNPNTPEVIVVVDENGTPLGTYHKKATPDGGFIYVDENGVPLGTTKVVKTGNDFPEVIFMMIAVLSLIGAFVLRRAIKKATY